MAALTFRTTVRQGHASCLANQPRRGLLPKRSWIDEFGQSVVLRKLQESGDFERARKLANEFTWNKPSSKQEVLKELDDYQRVATEDTTAELLKEANELRDDGERLDYFFRKRPI